MKKIIIPLFVLIANFSTIQCLQKALDSVAKEKQKIDKREYQAKRSEEIHFSDHAEKQMKERGVSRGEVEKTIKYGTRSVNKREKSVKFLRKHIMVIMDLDEHTVITVYASKKNDADILSKKQRSIISKKEKDQRRMPQTLTRETKSFVNTLNP